jgi:hypothetical protein
MKTTFLLTLIVSMFSFSVLAQDCKFDTKKKDKKTGKITVSNFHIFGAFGFILQKKDGQVTLQIDYTWNSYDEPVPIGTEVQFKLGNGDIVTCTTKEETKAEKGWDAAKKTPVSAFHIVFDIPSDELEKLSKSAPVEMKIYYYHRHYTKEIKAKKAEDLSRSAKCLLEFKD